MSAEQAREAATPPVRWDAQGLRQFAEQCLERAGLEARRSRVLAELLVEADLMGHFTHGLQLLPRYAQDLAGGGMAVAGDPTVVRDMHSAVTWDGQYLPGPCLVMEAMDEALDRLKDHPVVTYVIRRSHHIACLAVYLERATREGAMVILASADPDAATVAPHGGIRPVMTPNPLGIGIPTEGDPILVDISTSSTANRQIAQAREEGRKLPPDWAQDSDGNPTTEPIRLSGEGAGTVLPLGGMEAGHKGFGLGLMVEAMTCALGGGAGRSDSPGRWGASVFLQLIRAEGFGGESFFRREMQHLVEACHACPPRPGVEAVRMPGERGLKLKREQLAHGIALPDRLVERLAGYAGESGVGFPLPLK